MSEYRGNENVVVDMDMDLSKYQKGSGNSGKRRKSDANPDKGILTDFPRGIIALAVSEFPTASRQTDAIVCYMCLHCPDMADPAFRKANLTPEQQDLLRGRESDLGGKLMKSNREMLNKEDANRHQMELNCYLSAFETYFRLGFDNGPRLLSVEDLRPDHVNTDTFRLFMERIMDCNSDFWREYKERHGAGLKPLYLQK